MLGMILGGEIGRPGDEEVVLLQVPKLGWQPAPQYSIVLPQKPAEEQQFWLV